VTTQSKPLNRRASLALAVLWPLLARAQSSNRSWRIGYLGPSAETAPQLLRAFQDGLAALGYVEGRKHRHRVPLDQCRHSD
jgi:hypothetical protein